MKHKDLPQRWKNRIEDYLQANGSKYKELSAYDFSPNLNLKITFADDSYAFFKYAFYWIDSDVKEVAIFTEHCGYHVFPLIDTKFETVDSDGNTVKTEDFTIE